MNKNLRELNARKAKHVAAMRAITDKAAKESRDLTEAEAAEFDKEKAALATTNAAIQREQDLIEAERSAGVEVPDDAAISAALRAPRRIHVAGSARSASSWDPYVAPAPISPIRAMSVSRSVRPRQARSATRPAASMAAS
jgi:hypothetical protein